jgi:sugar/nucleoside kinase (ribokinase family)
VDATGERTQSLLICAIGDLIMDVLVLPAAPLRADADTPASIQFRAGGQAANVAAWAAALGARSRLICARGNDPSSELTTAELASHGVEIRGPVLDGPGGVVVSVGDGAGGRTMASDRGVAPQLSPADIEPAWVETCDVLHVSGYCLLREPMAEAAIEAARLAPRVTVDLASEHDIELIGAQCFAARLRALAPELAFATEAERAAVPGFDTSWVVKLGARGALFPEGEYRAATADVVDATGAGDALAAGYLVGGPALAIEVAARSVSHIGAMPPRDR